MQQAAAKKKKSTKPKKDDAEAAPTVIEMDKEGGFDISNNGSANEVPQAAVTGSAKELTPASPLPDNNQKPEATATAAPTSSATETTESEAPPKDDDDDKKNEQPPVGNGGTVEGKYVWTQTLSEVTVTIPVPDNTRGRDLNVVLAKQHLKVGLRSAVATAGEWIINARLIKPIICDDSFWTVEDGNRLVISLQKLQQMEWWKGVCEGDPTIDVTKIQPENSSLSDLDGETRKTV